MKRAALVVLGLAIFFAALVAQAPATLADRLCALASGGSWRLADARGTLWRGSALPVHAGSATTLPRLDWQLVTGQLVGGAFAVELRLTGGDAALQARLVARPGRVTLAADGGLPAATLAAIATIATGQKLPTSLGIVPGGRVQIASDGLAYDRDGYRGRLTLSWADARLSAGDRLGSYRLELAGAGEALSGRLHTLAGPLQLAGELRLTPAAEPGRRLAAELSASLPAAPAAAPGLAALLGLAGQSGADRRLELRL